MKKKVFVILGAILFSSTAFADNASRIKILLDELKTISEQIQQRQSEISQLTQKALMDQGAIEELRKQDEGNKKDRK